MNKKNQERENFNPMFLWTRFINKELTELPGLKGKKINPWVFPVIHGYFIQASILTSYNFVLFFFGASERFPLLQIFRNGRLW
jgi:hypothetical protein